jgi:hypothetical protein
MPWAARPYLRPNQLRPPQTLNPTTDGSGLLPGSGDDIVGLGDHDDRSRTLVDGNGPPVAGGVPGQVAGKRDLAGQERGQGGHRVIVGVAGPLEAHSLDDVL